MSIERFLATIAIIFALFVMLCRLSFGAQYNPVLSTTSPYPGLTMLSNANSSFAALLSNNSGATAPAYGVEGSLFVNTSSSLLEFDSGSNWLNLGKFSGTQFGLVSNGVPLTAPTSTGSSNAYVVTYSPAPTALVVGQHYPFIASFANTTTSSLNPNGLGLHSLTKQGAVGLISGDIPSGAVVDDVWDGTEFQMTSQTGNSASGTVTSIATNNGVTGGTITGSGTVGLASISNNQVMANISGSSTYPSGTGSPVTTSWGIGQTTTSASSAAFVGMHSTTNGALSLSTSGAGDSLVIGMDGGAIIGSPTGGDQGAGTLNMAGCYVNGTACVTSVPPSGMTLLATVNASAATSVTFSSTYITSTYNKYVIEIDGLYTNDGAGIQLQFSTNNGSSYITSTAYHQANIGHSAYAATISAALFIGGIFSNGDSDFGGGSLGSSSSNPAQATIRFSKPSASANMMVDWTFINGTGASPGYDAGGGTNDSTTAINNIKFTDSGGGNITGNFHLYGLAGN